MRTHHPRPWRRGSDYAAPPRNALDRGQRHVWRRRVVAELRAGNLPGKSVLTSEALLACMNDAGELFPSYGAIASKAGIGVRTVARHLNRLEELGLIRRHRRLVRMLWPEGGRGATRVQQTSNAYELLFPIGPVVAKAPRVRLNTGCHSGRVHPDRRFILGPSTPQDEARRVLEQVRAQRTLAIAATWQRRSGTHVRV